MLRLIDEIKDSNFNEKIGPALAMDVLRVMVIDAICLCQRTARWLRRGGSLGTVTFYPVKPRPWYDIWNVCTWLNLNMKVAKTGSPLFIFQDKTKLDFTPEPAAHTISINARCCDVSKTTVAKVFEEVTGRSLAVNPTTHTGPMVEKGEENGLHNGRVVQGPIAKAKPGCVYQKLVDNRLDDTLVEDLRAIIIGSEIVHVYRKQRPIADRFANYNVKVSWVPAAQVFTTEEHCQILTIAQKLGLDYGGIDILRDRNDGQIYSVDINKTTMGLPIKLPLLAKITCTQRKAEAFERQFLNHLVR
jgi:hypothetical protein